jgi:hypothetical protein
MNARTTQAPKALTLRRMRGLDARIRSGEADRSVLTLLSRSELLALRIIHAENRRSPERGPP